MAAKRSLAAAWVGASFKESAKKAQETMKSVSPTLRASIQVGWDGHALAARLSPGLDRRPPRPSYTELHEVCGVLECAMRLAGNNGSSRRMLSLSL